MAGPGGHGAMNGEHSAYHPILVQHIDALHASMSALLQLAGVARRRCTARHLRCAVIMPARRTGVAPSSSAGKSRSAARAAASCQDRKRAFVSSLPCAQHSFYKTAPESLRAS
jgi:hypothetical protein